jgi:hypothetical protein
MFRHPGRMSIRLPGLRSQVSARRTCYHLGVFFWRGSSSVNLLLNFMQQFIAVSWNFMQEEEKMLRFPFLIIFLKKHLFAV